MSEQPMSTDLIVADMDKNLAIAVKVSYDSNGFMD